MGKRIYPFLLLVLLVLAACASDSGSSLNGKELYRHAELLDSTGAYLSAKYCYQQARTALIAEGTAVLAGRCRLSGYRIKKILTDYNTDTTEARVRAELKEKFPDISESKILWLLARVDYLDIEGTRYYF